MAQGPRKWPNSDMAEERLIHLPRKSHHPTDHGRSRHWNRRFPKFHPALLELRSSALPLLRLQIQRHRLLLPRWMAQDKQLEGVHSLLERTRVEKICATCNQRECGSPETPHPWTKCLYLRQRACKVHALECREGVQVSHRSRCGCRGVCEADEEGTEVLAGSLVRYVN